MIQATQIGINKKIPTLLKILTLKLMDGLTDQPTKVVKQMNTKRRVFSQEKSGSLERNGQLQTKNFRLEYIFQVQVVREEGLRIVIFSLTFLF